MTRSVRRNFIKGDPVKRFLKKSPIFLGEFKQKILLTGIGNLARKNLPVCASDYAPTFRIRPSPREA